MGLFCKIITLSLLVQVSLGVVVTLEDGKKVMAAKRVKVGENTLLGCSANPSIQSSGNPIFEWTYDKVSTTAGTHIYSSAKPDLIKEFPRFSITSPYSLQINSLEASDSGFYQCRVTMFGDTPSVDEGVYNLTVLVPPSEQISCGFPSDLQITLGQSVQFHCREQVAQAVPAPTYTWYKNNVPLPLVPGNDPRFSNSSYSYSDVTGIISFSSVVAGDAGTYQCEASNEVGTERCNAANITTKEQNVGLIVGVVFAVIFAILLIAVLVWWCWTRGHCDRFFEGKEGDEDAPDDGANDIMLDGAGPLVTKEPSEWSNGTSNKNSMRSTEHRMPEGAIRVMP